MEINVSICASAHRVENWLRIYESIKTNINLEILFVSNKKPDITLPDNFKVIYSTVKPAQCYEIAFRQAKGELIFWTTDATIYSPYAFDNAFTMYKNANDYKMLTAFTVYEGSEVDQLNYLKDTTQTHFLFNRTHLKSDMDTPRTMPFGCISNKFMKELGGYDNRFICGQSENDLVLRAYNRGAKIQICKEAIAYNIVEMHNNEWNFRGPTAHYEIGLVQKLWTHNGNIIKDRDVFYPFQPYKDEDILTVSQGLSSLRGLEAGGEGREWK